MVQPVPTLGLVAALALTAAAEAPGQTSPALARQVESMLERARPALETHLKTAERGKLALTCLAALHDGLEPDAQPLRGALNRLVAAMELRTYDIALRILVFGLLPEDPRRLDVLTEDTATLLSHQKLDGYFGYDTFLPGGDLSNSQYAALALRVADRFGIEVPASSVRDLVATALAAQRPDGSFAYRAGAEYVSTASMTVAGIAVLEIGAQIVELDDDAMARARRAIATAWEWMNEHAGVIGDAKVANCLYMHYGLERAAILSGRTRVGDVDWYARGTRMLQALELQNGGFSVGRGATRLADPATLIDTAFGVLFLRKQFQRTLPGPITGAPTYLCHTLPAEASERQLEAAVRLDIERGLEAVPNLLEAMRTGNYPQRRAAAQALEEISGHDFHFDPDRGSRRNAEALRRAERWWMRARAREAR